MSEWLISTLKGEVATQAVVIWDDVYCEIYILMKACISTNSW